jgi:polar amino acid transport system substrate-binding protein
MSGMRYALLLAFFPTSHALGAQVVKVCHEEVPRNQTPISAIGARNQMLVQQVADRVGLKLGVISLPWKRCLANVADGSVDAAIDASYTEERAAYAVYPLTQAGEPDVRRRLRFGGYTFYRLKGSKVNWNGKNFSNLEGPVGLQLGYSVGSELTKSDVPIFESAGDARNQMRALVNGRLALIVLLTEDGDALLRDPAFSERVEARVPAYLKKPYFVIFNKRYYADNQKSVEQFWWTLEKVRDAK